MFEKSPSIGKIIFRLANYWEHLAAHALGKGYGSGTIHQEVKLVLQLLATSPALAIDIGGNVGEYTAELRRTNPKLEIHTFEPSAINIAKLEARFTGDAGIHLVPLAISEAAGQATLFSDTPGSGMSSLTKRKLEHFNIEFNQSETVSTVRFEDYWLTKLDKRQIDIVKLDIEGHEFSALKSFGTAIHATKAIQFEFGGTNIDTRTFFQDFWYFFKEYDFTLFRITPFGLEKIDRYKETDEFFSTTNYIAVNLKKM